MTARLLPLALLLAAAAGCGPDCDRYCRKLLQCATEHPQRGLTVDVAQCVIGCNDASASRSDTIQCYIDKSCPDIDAGHCSVTGTSPK